MAQKIEMDKKLGGSDIDSDFSLHRDCELICHSIRQKIEFCMKKNLEQAS